MIALFMFFNCYGFILNHSNKNTKGFLNTYLTRDRYVTSA